MGTDEHGTNKQESGPPDEPEKDQQMFTLAEAQERLGLTRVRMMQLIKAGELQSEKRLDERTGSKRYISRAEMERFIQARTAEATQPKDPKGGRPKKVPKLLD